MPNIHLYQFQKEAIQKFLKSGSLIAALPTGTGKTVVAISIILKLHNIYGKDFKCLVIVPANLRSNFSDTITKFHLNISNKVITKVSDFHESMKKGNLSVISYNFLRMYFNEIVKYDYHLVVCDELHYAKNSGSTTFKTLFSLRQITQHFLGLTASPVSNNAKEFFTIVALVANDKTIINEGMKLVKYIRVGRKEPSLIQKWLFGAKPKGGTRVQVGITDQYEFKRLVSRWIYIPTHHKISVTGKRPDVKTFVIKVPLTKYEAQVYKYVIGKIPALLLKQLQRGTISDNDVRKIKNWLMAAQQVLLSPDYVIANDNRDVVAATTARAGSKIMRVGQMIKQSGEQSIVFTPFLRFGAQVANRYFNSIGIKSVEYSGAISKQERKEIVEKYENQQIQVICLTGAGQEGINLPSCKNVFFLSMHFNPEVMRQVMGRALRITSKNPYVNVYTIFAVIKKGPFMYEKTVDQWISAIVNRKTLLRQAIYNILQEVDLEE